MTEGVAYVPTPKERKCVDQIMEALTPLPKDVAAAVLTYVGTLLAEPAKNVNAELRSLGEILPALEGLSLEQVDRLLKFAQSVHKMTPRS